MTFDFMGNRYKAFAFSGTLSALSIIIILVFGFNYGIDFRGGNLIQVRFNSPMDEVKIRDAFEKMGKLYFKPDQLVIQSVAGAGVGKEYIIQYPASPSDDPIYAAQHSEILSKLKEFAPYDDNYIQTSNIGPTVGSEMKRQAIVASILSIIGILLYLAWRFENQSAIGAVLSIVHDLVVVSGFVAALQIEFDVTVLAAILTMLGYSVNDSIVVLDRIRENRRLYKDRGMADLINDSINQTLGRTIRTSVTVLFTLFSLFFFGGTTIHNFSLTLLIGVFFGTYSSIFIASPVLIHMAPPKRKHSR
ncbi:MAG: protein translocase subunit SecF [Candidatus Riflebacteria bacterium]|nr:protein translocase subunit SecF [Candidatus Riflebacteria bacterium]